MQQQPIGLSSRPSSVLSHRRNLLDRSGKAVVIVVLAAAALALMYPFFFMIETSFKSERQYLSGSGFSLASWSKLFQGVPVGHEMLNSFFLCAASIGIILVIAVPVGFAFAKTTFRGHRLAFVAIVGSMLIPLQSIIIPEYVNFSHLHLVNTYLGATLVYVAIGTPFSVFLAAAFFRGIPDELVQAGLCDGLTYFGVFRRLALSLTGPVVATLIVLRFIPVWNDFLVGLLFLQEPSNRPFTVGLGVLASSQLVNVPALMAGSLLSTIPAALTYVIFQRNLVAGLTLGSVQ